MSAEDVASTVRDFFARHSGASLRLPDGWFGKPYDNFHELTSVIRDGTLVTITLDERQILRIDDPVAIDDGRVLRLKDFAHAVWAWCEYEATGPDPSRPHRSEFFDGAVEFFSPDAGMG